MFKRGQVTLSIIAGIVIFAVSLIQLLISVSPVLGLLDARCADNDYLSENSDIIIIGLVLESKSIKEGNNSIYTLTKVQVQSLIKGNTNTSNIIEIRTEGGEINDIGLKVEDQPEFTIGQYGKFYLKVYKPEQNLLFKPLCGMGVEIVNNNAKDNSSILRKIIIRLINRIVNLFNF